MKRFELANIYDYRKSFYGKAIVEETEDTKTLYSYNTKVAESRNGKLVIFNVKQWDSNTTLRHIKEFAQQFCNLPLLTKTELKKYLEVK